MSIRPLEGVTLRLAEAPTGLQATREALALRMGLLGARVCAAAGVQGLDGQLTAWLEDAAGARVTLYVRGWPCGYSR